jgi:hypothetical protein
MKRRSSVGGAFAGVSITREFAAPRKVTSSEIPTVTFGKTGVKVTGTGRRPDEPPPGCSDSGGARA